MSYRSRLADWPGTGTGGPWNPLPAGMLAVAFVIGAAR